MLKILKEKSDVSCFYTDLNEKGGIKAVGLEAIVGGEPGGIPWK